MNRIRYRTPSPSMCVALVALFVALGGTAYAAGLPGGSVGTFQLRDSSVSTAKLQTFSVTAFKIKTANVTTAKLAPAAVTYEKLKGGAVRSSTVANGTLRGEDAATGEFLGGSITVQRTDVPLPDASGVVVAQATCPAGSQIIGGGAAVAQANNTDASINASRPFRTGAEGGLPVSGETFDSWRVVAINPAGGTGATTLRSFAICSI